MAPGIALKDCKRQQMHNEWMLNTHGTLGRAYGKEHVNVNGYDFLHVPHLTTHIPKP
jgi:hypothetical protein